MSREYYDPWAKVGQAANNALFQYLSSRPNPQQQAAAQADIDAKRALTNKYGLEARQIQSQLDAPDAMRSALANIYAQVEAPQSPDFVGPGMPTAPSADVINQRYQQNMPDIFSTAMQYAGAKPQNIGDIFAAFAANSGANPDQITNAQMGAGMDYAKTRSGFEADPENRVIRLTPGSILADYDGNEILSAPFKGNSLPANINPTLTNPNQLPMSESGIAPTDSTIANTYPEPNSAHLYDKAGRSGGVLGKAVELYTDYAGQLLPVPDSFEGVVQDRQDLITAQNMLTRALSLNPKMPVAEIKRIMAENPVQPSAGRSGESSQAKLRSLAASMKQIQQNAMNDVYDPNLNEKDRQLQYKSVKDIQRFLDALGIPESQNMTPVNNQKQGRRSLDEIFGR